MDSFTNLPEIVLQTFCSDLGSGNYQAAYKLGSGNFDASVGGQVSFSTATADYSACQPQTILSLNGALVAPMTFTLKSGESTPYVGTLTLNKNAGIWEMDNLVNYPAQTLGTFCNDLTNHNYTDAYAQLTPGVHSVITLQAFTQNYSQASGCTTTLPLQNGSDSATSIVTFTLNKGGAAKQTATLAEESLESWKIASLLNA